MDILTPFFCAANTVTYLNPKAIDQKGNLKLDVVSGGPAFVFFGRRELAQAQRVVAPNPARPTDIEFDMACAAASDTERDIDAGLGEVTIFAIADTIGYLQFRTGSTPVSV